MPQSQITAITNEPRFIVFTRDNGSTFSLDKTETILLNSNNGKVYVKYSENLLTIDQSEVVTPSSTSAADLEAQIRDYFNHTNSDDKNIISVPNSTTTPLASLAVFTGDWVDVTSYPSIVVAVKTDQDGTFQIQYSPDGTNVDSTLTRYYRTTQIEPPHRFTNTRRYVRVVFTNTSASSQTFIRLQTILGTRTDLNAPTDSTLSQDFDAIVTRPTLYKYETALGRRQGSTTWNKFGYNNNLSSGTEETVWSTGGVFTFLTAASTFTIVSTSAQDTNLTGTGAWNVIVYYIDANREAQIEVVPLNGTTPVVTTGSGLGINRVSIFNSGTGLTNVGTINITATTGGTTQAQIPLGTNGVGGGTTQQSIFFTQAKHQFLADWLYINTNKTSGGGNPRVEIFGYVYSFVSNALYEIFYTLIDTQIENTIAINPAQPFVVGEQSILYFNAISNTNNTTISIRLSGVEIKDVDA